MKKMEFSGLIKILIFLSLSAAFMSGCFRPIGKCTYGDTPSQEGKLKIVQIKKNTVDGASGYTVSVEGFFRRNFFYSEEKFIKCFSSGRYTNGSEVTGIVTPGGPCPPIYEIDICR